MDQNCQNINHWQKERSQQDKQTYCKTYLTQKILESTDWLWVYKHNLGIVGGSGVRNSYDVM